MVSIRPRTRCGEFDPHLFRLALRYMQKWEHDYYIVENGQTLLVAPEVADEFREYVRC